MTVITLPRAFTRSEFGWPLYGARMPLDNAEVSFSVPFLSDRIGARWETKDEASGCFEELTAGVWAQLFFLSPIDPEHVAPAVAVAAGDRVLVDHRCDLTACAAEVCVEMAEWPETCARFDQCVLLAARLAGVRL